MSNLRYSLQLVTNKLVNLMKNYKTTIFSQKNEKHVGILKGKKRTNKIGMVPQQQNYSNHFTIYIQLKYKIKTFYKNIHNS